MIDEACALSGRKGFRVKESEDNPDVAIDPGDLAELAAADIVITPQPNVDVSVDTTHTATPELSHPGESQSNGKAERAVGEYVGQLRTLKVALESRIKCRLSCSHPVMQWLIEHTSNVLNKYALGSDGHTPWGRLHGQEGRERICEFGECIMWYVPKKMRSKLDQRWRYGFFWVDQCRLIEILLVWPMAM